jgi:hypothetical protein
LSPAVLVIGSFIAGAIVDHFLEVRSIANVKRAIKESEDRILAEVRKEKGKSAKAGD